MSGKGIYDIHCHIVPGVDDGATDIEETGKLLRMEYEQGVRTIIATPHFRFRMFETSAEKVKEQFKLVEKAAAEVASDLHVYLGCEFHTNMEMISMLRENKVMTMAGSRYVLTEFSHNSEENYIRERLSTLLSGGYKPIVAHIERYEATRTSMDFVEELVDMGVCMQINADSITGKDGFFTNRIFCISSVQTAITVQRESAGLVRHTVWLLRNSVRTMQMNCLFVILSEFWKRKNKTTG